MPLNMQQTGSPIARRVLLVVLLVVSIVLVTLYGREAEDGPIHNVQNAVMNVTNRAGGATAGIGTVGEAASGALADATANPSTLTGLREQNEQLRLLLSNAEEYRQEAERLQGLLDMKNISGVTGPVAHIIGRSTNAWDQSITIDRGTDDMVDSRVYSIEKRGMEAADRVVTVSDLTRNIVINKYGINPDKVVTVHNAVDFSGRENLQVDRGVRDKVVTFLGRITFQKGPEYFIEAAAKVLKRTKNVRFVMAGSGDMMNRAIRQVARLGISDRFHFTGFLRGQEVQKMFDIMPSVSEPFGISPLEAMRSNVPSIISHQSGAAEVLKYALKVDFWDVDAMADDIYALLQYPALSDFANRQGFDEVNALKWNNATLKLKKVYESVVNS